MMMLEAWDKWIVWSENLGITVGTLTCPHQSGKGVRQGWAYRGYPLFLCSPCYDAYRKELDQQNENLG